jgi:hypothetical protein
MPNDQSPEDPNRPATLGDILAVEQRLEKHILAAEERSQKRVQESEERMQEFMRGLQTELLRGFGRFNECTARCY